MKKTILVFAFLMMASSITNAETQFIKYKNYLIPISTEACENPKILISTDYGDWTQDRDGINDSNGGGDADEAQSLSHFLMYSNLFDVRGIVTSDSIGRGKVSEVNKHLDEYEYDYDNNGWGAKGYMPREDFVVKQGITLTGENTPAYNSSTAKTNEAVQLIVDEAKNASPTCPLNIAVWGGILEVTAALDLLNIEDPSYLNNLSIVAVGSTNIGPGSRDEDRNWVKNAWDRSQELLGIDFLIPLDFSFRALTPRRCNAVNEIVYDNVGSEDIMDELTNINANRSIIPVTRSTFPTTSARGMRALLQSARYHSHTSNCADDSMNPINSFKIGDILTTLYFLDREYQLFDGLQEFTENQSYDVGTASIYNDAFDSIDGRKNYIEHYIALKKNLYDE